MTSLEAPTSWWRKLAVFCAGRAAFLPPRPAVRRWNTSLNCRHPCYGRSPVKDPHLCVSFLNRAESPGLYEFSAQNRGLVTALGIAAIDAIHDGEVKQVDRPAPTDRDFAELEKALRGNGLGTPEIEALLDGKVSEPPLADEKLCQAGQIYLETLAAMPEPSRVRIYGFAIGLMARS